MLSSFSHSNATRAPHARALGVPHALINLAGGVCTRQTAPAAPTPGRQAAPKRPAAAPTPGLVRLPLIHMEGSGLPGGTAAPIQPGELVPSGLAAGRCQKSLPRARVCGSRLARARPTRSGAWRISAPTSGRASWPRHLGPRPGPTSSPPPRRRRAPWFGSSPPTWRPRSTRSTTSDSGLYHNTNYC